MEKKERLADRLNGKKVALIGAGVSNMPLIPFLIGRGADVTVRDGKTEEKLGEKAGLIKKYGAALVAGEGYLDGLCEDVIVRSPGIRPDIPEFTEAVRRGAILTSEMELFLTHTACRVFAVTGSDGKSTTTTVLSKLLETLPGGKTYLGGNIGHPLFHLYPEMEPEDKAAVELSSFQLMTADAPVEAAVITNVTPNHLNWHTGMDEYIEAKKRILLHAGRAVLNYDCPVTREIGETAGCPVTFFSRTPVPDGALRNGDSAIYLKNGVIVKRDRGGAEREFISRSDILLPGMHNAENYMAAIAAAGEELDPEAAREIARTFPGVEHRLEFVREHRGVRYYNGSIDSSPTRTAAALSALADTMPDRRIVAICGGYDKNIPFEPLAEALLGSETVRAVVLTGATAEKIKTAVTSSPLWEARRDGGFLLIDGGDFEDAVAKASETARAGETVILSPACASFDRFENFEERGRLFKELVRAL